jgi:hypothetical protein
MSTQQVEPATTGPGSAPVPRAASFADAERLPRPPGRHRRGLAALAVLLIVLGAAAAGLLAVRVDERRAVLVARRPIGVGQLISSADLAVARIAADGVAVIPADAAGTVIGRYAAGRIEAGRLIDAGMVSTSGLLTVGKAALGLSLSPGRFPAGGLASGDVVQVIRSVDGTGKVIADRAVVGSVVSPTGGVFSGSTSDAVVVTVVVPEAQSAAVAAAGAADQASVALLARGETTP